MRSVFAFLLFLTAVGLGFSQNLTTPNAPKAFLGFSFGATFAEVTAGLAGVPVQSDKVPGKDGIQKVTVPHQKLDKLENITAELVFYQDRLFQISASTPYQSEVLKSLVDVLGSKYGPVKSQDGGYSYLWFFYAKLPGSGTPDFAVSLRGDSVTAKTIVLTYVDNRVRRTASSGAGANAPQPAPAPETVAPTLDAGNF